MKTSKQLFLAALMGLMLLATQSFSQRGTRSNDCYQNIPNMTEKQQEQIEKLRTEHLNEMAQLRQDRRATFNLEKKDEIREKMLQNTDTHKNEVRALLNTEQRAYFDTNYQNGFNRSGRGKGNRGNRGRGNSSYGSQNGSGNRGW